jgi:hypothetical protein
MSQTNKVPVLKVRNKKPGITTGANTEVTLDGKPLTNISFLKIEIRARKVAKVMMEMYVEVDAEIEPGDPTITIKKVTGWHNILGDLCKQFFKMK